MTEKNKQNNKRIEENLPRIICHARYIQGSGVLTIDTKHPCGNLVHERELLNLTWGENGSLLSVTKSSEQTKKSRKITSLQLNHSSCFLKLPIGSGANHLIFKPDFPVFAHVNETYPQV